MRSKHQIVSLFFAFCVMFVQGSLNASTHSSTIYEDLDHYTQALASLVYHLQEQHENREVDAIEWPESSVDALWNRAFAFLESTDDASERCILSEAASIYYCCRDLGLSSETSESLERCCDKMKMLWHAAIEKEEGVNTSPISPGAILRQKAGFDPNLERNPYLSKDARKKMKPFLLPFRHSMRCLLDRFCLKQRITVDRETFEAAGFHIISSRPRSHISVASHSEMPGYLVKVYFDTVLEKKRKKASWEWLVFRCEGAFKVHNVIRDKEIRHFTVARKWIYCLPAQPSPPQDSMHTRHFALLLVTDMDLVSNEENYQAWKTIITEEHLIELYQIICRAKGSSYRPDNIAYTHHGTFAFIDTEYPSEGPDFKHIRPHLNGEMRAYWDRIVINGGN